MGRTDYLSALKARGLSRRTLRETEYVLGSVFGPWCREQGITSIESHDQRVLDRWTGHLLEEG